MHRPSVALPGPSKLPNSRNLNPARSIILSSDDESEIEVLGFISENTTQKAGPIDTAFKGKSLLRDVEDPTKVTDSDDAIIVL